MRSEIFLQKYRILEGLLEKRYDGCRMHSSSVVMEFLRDDSSEGIRVDLDLIRELRNLLTHNAGADGAPIAEPSEEIIRRLDEIIEIVRKPRLAVDYGTPADRVLFAHLNDKLSHVMSAMRKNGYSHVPVVDRGRICGVLSVKSVFDYIAEKGAGSLRDDFRICDLGDRINLNRTVGDRYLFMPANANIEAVRSAFERYTERNCRLGAVFISENGTPDEKLICIITPWDVMTDRQGTQTEGVYTRNGKA